MPLPRKHAPSSGSSDPDIHLFVVVFTWLRRRLLRLALRPYFGWTLVLVVGAIFAAAGVVTLLATKLIPGRAAARLGWYLLLSAWLCLGVLFGLLRRSLKHPRPGWDALTAFGRIGRILVTACGTALFLAPFLWIAWKVAGR
jgi:hypothetical protein